MKYDLAIIGGGPAGLMAAWHASKNGRQVILLEKNQRLGLKLLTTGGGRCNLTHNIPDHRLLAANFGPQGRFLLSAFSRFGVLETMAFFEAQGLKLKTENTNKVFPVSNLALDVLQVLIDGIQAQGGIIETECEVKDFVLDGDTIEKVVLTTGEEISADNFLIATGGLSYPGTGSTGAGYEWLKKMGHTITPLSPALTPILVREEFVSYLEGLSLENIKVSLYDKNKKVAKEQGPIIFTASGLSGPATLNISRHLDYKSAQSYSLELDLQPGKTLEDLDRELLALVTGNNKFLRNSLEGVLPERMVGAVLNISKISPEKLANNLSKLERQALARTMKTLRLEVKSVEGFERAMVTRGGLELKEIDPKTMKSKLISNLYVAGEILDLVGPTGGFNLQLCWSTGFVAGESV